MKSGFKTKLQILRQPVFVMFFVSLLLVLINLVVLHHTRPYNSDDVSWQDILTTWQPSGHDTVYLGGSDNFVAKVPFFWLFSHVFSPSRRLLLIEAAFFAFLLFGFYYASAVYFLKKLKIARTYSNLLPLVWFASFGYAVTHSYLNPILRNFELGLSFVFFAVIAKIYYKEFQPWASIRNRLLGILLCCLAGVLVYSDPYFSYFTLIPIVALYLILYTLNKVRGKAITVVMSGVALSLLFAKVLSVLAHHAGLQPAFEQPIQFVSFDNLGANLSYTIHGILVLFGADFFGEKVFSLKTISALLNLGVLGAIAYQLVTVVKNFRHSNAPIDLWKKFFGGIGIFVVAVYIFSNVADGLGTYRYMIMMVLALILFLTLVVDSMPYKRLVTLLVVLAIVANMIVSLVNVNTAKDSTGNIANSENLQITATLQQFGLKKGYAPYWDGNINTYLSKESTQFLPITCIDHETHPLNFLVDSAKFHIAANKSFYIIDPDLTSPPTCTTMEVTQQFGMPSHSLTINNKTILIYNYDILKKM